MSATPERLSWRESVAAQLYEIADRWSRGEMSDGADGYGGLMEALALVKLRVMARHGCVSDVANEREQEWR